MNKAGSETALPYLFQDMVTKWFGPIDCLLPCWGTGGFSLCVLFMISSTPSLGYILSLTFITI